MPAALWAMTGREFFDLARHRLDYLRKEQEAERRQREQEADLSLRLAALVTSGLRRAWGGGESPAQLYEGWSGRTWDGKARGPERQGDLLDELEAKYERGELIIRK